MDKISTQCLILCIVFPCLISLFLLTLPFDLFVFASSVVGLLFFLISSVVGLLL